MSQRENEKGKKPVLKRKHFILALIAVCAIAVIAEGVLLAKTFGKKDKNGDNQKNGKQDSVVIEVPDGYQKVWKVTKEVLYGSRTETQAETVFEYDELGRLKTMKSSYEDGTEDYIEWKYEKSGRKVTAWSLEKGTPRTDRNIYFIAFEIIPGPGGVSAASWMNVRNSKGISLEYDEEGYWKSVTAMYPAGGYAFSPVEEYTFSYDSQRRITGYTRWGQEADGSQKKIKDDRRLEFDEENSSRITAYYSSPDEKTFKKIFENGRKVLEGYVSENGEFRVTSDWTYSEDGFICNNYNEDGSIWKTIEEYEIPLPVPNLSHGYESITFSCESLPENYTDYIERDDQGRISGVVRRYSNIEREVLVQVEYDDQGRIISRTEDGVVTTFLYDENGNIIEDYETDAETGKIKQGRKYEYSEIVVPIS